MELAHDVLPCLIFVIICSTFCCSEAQLKEDFYRNSCPQAENIIRDVVTRAVQVNKGIAAGLLRLHFHDCFVEGCDGSVLIDSTPTNRAEKEAGSNRSLRGFEVIDLAKRRLEAVCPGTVSCADIVAFAARDGVSLVGGPLWSVPGGRRDGRISSASEAVANLPDPSFSVGQLTQNFAAKGLSQDDLITLSGAHTIGQAHCANFAGRLYGFNNFFDTDPTLDPFLAQNLKQQCPRDNPTPNAVVNLDPSTPDTFDNIYYTNLARGRGILQSDQVLFSAGPTTMPNVALNSFFGSSWMQKFPASMVKMGMIEVKTGRHGEIRKQCNVVN